jgi:putative SOS response-associated peptidase YedK
MCGRFALYSSGDEIARAFEVEVPELFPRYNVAPTQQVAALRAAEGGREFVLLRWGLLPKWSKDKKLAPINAMAETAPDKPMFRSAFKKRRCLIPADGWYEWQGMGKKKQPFFFGARDGKPLAFAGLWESCGLEGKLIDSCVVLTTTANEVVSVANDRMPAILPAESFERWLDPANDDKASLQDLLSPFPTEALFTRKVGTLVNNARNEDSRCMQEADS